MHMYSMVVTLNMDLAMNSQNVFSNSLSLSFIKKKNYFVGCERWEEVLQKIFC